MHTDYMTPENSTPGERAQARREMIAAEVEQERAERGDRAARKLERLLFKQWETVLGE